MIDDRANTHSFVNVSVQYKNVHIKTIQTSMSAPKMLLDTQIILYINIVFK